MLQRREDETVTAFTMRRLTLEIVCAELEALAKEFESSASLVWSNQDVADFLRDRADNHPDIGGGST